MVCGSEQHIRAEKLDEFLSNEGVAAHIGPTLVKRLSSCCNSRLQQVFAFVGCNSRPAICSRSLFCSRCSQPQSQLDQPHTLWHSSFVTDAASPPLYSEPPLDARRRECFILIFHNGVRTSLPLARWRACITGSSACMPIAIALSNSGARAHEE